MTRNNATGDFQKRINRRFIREYGFYLQRELDVYVRPDDGVSLYRHAMRIISSSDATIVTVQFILRTRFEEWIEDTASLGFTIFREGKDQSIAYQFSEQPLNRELGIHLYEGEDEHTMLHICRPSEAHVWSNIQAFHDSNDAIALILGKRLTSV